MPDCEEFKEGEAAWLNVGGDPTEGAGCFKCVVTAVGEETVHDAQGNSVTGKTVDVRIEDDKVGDLVKLAAIIKAGKGGKQQITASGLDIKGLSDGTVTDTQIKVCLRDPDWDNEDKTNGYDDMVDLANLNDAELNENLRKRFHKDMSYCYCGNTCVALNIFYSCGRGNKKVYPPFKEDYPHEGGVAGTARIDPFSEENQLKYMGAEKSTPQKEGGNAPHVYGVVEDAFQHLFTDHAGGKKNNQGIIITGESGAGKTYITGKCLEYLDAVNTHIRAGLGLPRDDITDLIKGTMPIMDNFGNACMPRNDDSSRFGKLYKIFYDDESHTVTGAKVEPYLLEKSRVSEQLSWERNFHIFYRMIGHFNTKEPEKKTQYHILDSYGQYKFLNRFSPGKEGDAGSVALENEGEVCQFKICNRYAFDTEKTFEVKNPEEDEEEFVKFETAMSSYFSAADMDQIFSILSAVLLIGNIRYDPEEEEGTILNKEIVVEIAELLKIPVALKPDKADDPEAPNFGKPLVKDNSKGQIFGKSLEEALTTVLTGGKFASPMNPSKCEGAAASFAQALYNDLFVQVVQTFSKKLLGTANESSQKFLGLLDIFGFEFIEESQLYKMEKKAYMRGPDYNGINQYFINLCNEKLQSHFVKSVFDIELKAFKDQGLTSITQDSFGFERNDDPEFGTVDMLMMDGGKTSSVINIMNEETFKQVDTSTDTKLKARNEKFTKSLNAQFGDVTKYKKYGTMKNGHMKKPGGFPSGNYDGNAFGVMHYAAMVTYACDNWWEQNKSTLPCWIHEVITTSTWEGRAAHEDREAGRYMMALFEETRGEGTGKAATIGSQFREQLLLLVDHTLEASNCTCQFVRCIKPNKDKFSRATAVPTADNAWQSAMVLNQLRYTGMLDTLMIRKKGFPTRPDHATFWKKFQILSPNVPKTDVKKLFDDIGQRVPPADKPDLFKESHYYWGEASGNGPTNNKVGNGPARVLMKDATYRYLEKQVTETREKFVTVLASVSRAAHLCDQFDVAKTAAKIIAPVAVQFVKQDKEVAQAEIPKMDAEKSSMEQFKMLNEAVEIQEQKERAQMFKEEKYIDKYMEAYAEARYKVQKVEHLQTAEDALAKCNQFMADFEAQLANSEPEPMDDTAFPDESNVPKFKWVKASADRPPRRAGSTKHRFKFAPKKTMI